MSRRLALATERVVDRASEGPRRRAMGRRLALAIERVVDRASEGPRRRTMSRSVVLAAALTVSSLGCSGAPEPVLVPPPPPSASAAAPLASATVDWLATRPTVPAPPPFVPPGPKVLAGPRGSTLWVLPRRALPLVSIAVVSRVGSAHDPEKLPGLAHFTVDMADEGAGSRDALQLSAALDDLGASYGSSVSREDATLYLDVLSSHLEPALALLADIVTAPRHAEPDFARVRDLWKNALSARTDDPQEVARLVASAALFGPDSPYGHPTDGTMAANRTVTRADVAACHARIFDPANLTFVVTGDVAEEQVKGLLDKAFDKLAPSKGPKVALRAPRLSTPPRVIAVIRDEAPQVVMTVIRRAPAASAKERPLLSLLNVALGGSFTSRLNQNLREDHGWTYGAASRFVGYREDGVFLARASIRADAIAPALGETLKELDRMAALGPTSDELPKMKALMRADAVGTYGTLRGIVHSLATNAALGLPPDVDALDLEVQSGATEAELARLAKAHVGSAEATIVLVGPIKAIFAAAKAQGLPEPELWTPDGRLFVRGTKAR